MSSDHFQHHLPHFHPRGDTSHPTTGLIVHTPLSEFGSNAVPGSGHAITRLTELRDSAGNLSVALTGHYQSLIEGHTVSIKPG
jgi:hypothetical protein